MPNTTTSTGDRVLYKFRHLRDDNDTDRSRVEDILVNHRLYLAAARSFNDPFECRVHYDADAPHEIKVAKIAEKLREREPISLREARKKAPTVIQSIEDGWRERVTDMLLDEAGMASLVAVRDDVLMWSHYASGHTGICIKFEARAVEHHDFFGSASKIVYQDYVPTLNWYFDDPVEIVRKSVYTKSTTWEYEHEYRIAQPKPPPNRYFYFDPLLVTAVYLGCRISHDDRERVKQWCKNRRGTVSIHQARLSDTETALRRMVRSSSHIGCRLYRPARKVR